MSVLGRGIGGPPAVPDFLETDESAGGFIRNKPKMEEYLRKDGGTITGQLDVQEPKKDSNAATKKYVDEARKTFQDITVQASAFESDSTYADYPYRAAVALTGVTGAMIPNVIFSVEAMENTGFAPVAECYNGGVYIYADGKPDGTVTIPTIMCWR